MHLYLVQCGGKCTSGGVEQGICSDEAFVVVIKHQAGVISAVYSDQLCAGTPSKFQLLALGGFDDDDHPLTFITDDNPYIRDGYIRLSFCDSLSVSYEVFSDALCTSSQFKSTFPIADFGPSSCQAAGRGSSQVEWWQ
ncbi:hypothetical protein B484DRAFT_396649 [Ochromonadaceae sp. CCMP2298]|nr:hypothetical protein B484DRAFT_396649 [Ochromonadaceae sp. CCMP2298]